MKKERFEELLKKEKMFDEMCKSDRSRVGAMPKRRRLSGSISGNQKKGREGEGDNVEVVEKEKVVGPKIYRRLRKGTQCVRFVK